MLMEIWDTFQPHSEYMVEKVRIVLWRTVEESLLGLNNPDEAHSIVQCVRDDYRMTILQLSSLPDSALKLLT